MDARSQQRKYLLSVSAHVNFTVVNFPSKNSCVTQQSIELASPRLPVAYSCFASKVLFAMPCTFIPRFVLITKSLYCSLSMHFTFASLSSSDSALHGSPPTRPSSIHVHSFSQSLFTHALMSGPLTNPQIGWTRLGWRILRRICASGIWWKKMCMTVSDGEHSQKVKPTNLEKKTLNGQSKKK